MTPFLEELIRRYETVGRRTIEARVGNAAVAQDLCQDVVRAILETDRKFESLDHLRNYFFAALRNAAVDHLRRRSRSREVALPPEAALPPHPAGDGPAAGLVAREEAALLKRRLETLRDALAALPEAQREVLRMRFGEQRTFQAIKEATGVSISTLKSREDAALRALKKCIGNEAGGA